MTGSTRSRLRPFLRDPRSPPAASVGRLATLFGTATVAGLAGQAVWLVLGSRALSRESFGAVLAAQALYALLQFVVDNGSAFHGARLVAQGRLDDRERARIARLRLELAGGSAVVLLAVGLAAGGTSLTAAAPFAAALVAWALFRYWEPFGRGDGRPFSLYVVLRSWAPALVAAPFLLADAAFPVYAAGLAEIAALVALAAAFRMRLVGQLRDALRAPRGPWLSVALLGGPIVLFQLTLATGTVLLNAVGLAAAAATYAVGMRLLTGVNQLTGALATALFPGLAAARQESPPRPGAFGSVSRAALGLAASAQAVACVAAALLARLFLNRTGGEVETVLILAVSAAAPTGVLIAATMTLFAREHERGALVPYGTMAAVTAGGGAAVALLDPGSPAAWMAGVFLAAQALGVSVLAARSRARLRPVAPELGWIAVAAVALALAGALAGLLDEIRPIVALALATAGLMLLVSSVPGLVTGVRRRLRSAATR
jgi:O-antigen/teichoic acid export membrane protein